MFYRLHPSAVLNILWYQILLHILKVWMFKGIFLLFLGNTTSEISQAAIMNGKLISTLVNSTYYVFFVDKNI